MTDVSKLPRRTAHAVHALLVASTELRMPVTAAEVCVYDQEALSVRHTGAALREASKRNLAVIAGRYWIPWGDALEQRKAFEDRYLRETDEL